MAIKSFKTYVFSYLPDAEQAVPAGMLTMLEEGVNTLGSSFGYGKQYLQRTNAIAVDPVSLPLEHVVDGTVREYEPVNGLVMFGAVRDALPDAWGRRVIENKLQVPANALSESQYLLHAGSNRLGALDFRGAPTEGEVVGVLASELDLQYLVDAADRIQHGEVIPDRLRRIFDAGPSMGGARPKAAIQKNSVAYVAKFMERNDVFNVPQIERATLELARACGLDVPATELISLPNNQWVMLIARFDRANNSNNAQVRKHTVSALTMLGVHESQSPDSSYAALADVISNVGAKGFVQQDRQELFARMVFNILVSNDDDHLRNHAFVWDAKLHGWRLSPLYDVLPKPQVAHERYLHLGVGMQGRLATLDNALSSAGRFGLTRVAAARIIDQIAMRVREWRVFFEREMQVPEQQCDLVSTAFRRPKDIGFDVVEKSL
jgi:serine/threonine-protein kinase HipA